MDELNKLFRDSSEQPRDFQPPEGQWEAIKTRLDKDVNGRTTLTGHSKKVVGLLWRVAAGILLLVALGWWVFSETESHLNNTQADNEQIEATIANERVGDEEQTIVSISANPELYSNREIAKEKPIEDSQLKTESESFKAANSSRDRSDNQVQVSEPAISESVEVLPTTFAEVASADGSVSRLASAPQLDKPEPISLGIDQISLPDNLSSFISPAAMPTSDSWRAAGTHRQGWDFSLNTVFLPIGSISSYVTEYTTIPLEATDAEIFEFDGQEIDLFRVTGSDLDLPGRPSWFFTASIGAGYRFANGLRIGAGVSYFDVSLFGRRGLRGEFPDADETLFFRERRYDNEVLLARLDFDFPVWQKNRFQVNVGATISGRVMSRYLHRHQLFQPYTQLKERLRNEKTLFINNSVNQHVVILPQIEMGYRLSANTDLTLGLGARLGLGFRHMLN